MGPDIRGKASRLAAVLGALGLILAHPTTAYAYIDPGSGSMLMQILLSAFFGAVFLARSFFGRLAASVRRIFGGKDAARTPPPDSPDA